MPTIMCNGKSVELTRIKITAPAKCPICDGEVGLRLKTGGEDSRILECKNPLCEAKSTGRLATWIKKLDIKNIGDSILEALQQTYKVSTPSDLYKLIRLDNLSVPLPSLMVGKSRLGEARAASITKEIMDKTVLPLHIFLGSLGVPHLGRRRCELIIEATGDKLKSLDKWLDGKTLLACAKEASIPGVASQIAAGLESLAGEIEKLKQYVKVVEFPAPAKVAKPSGGKLAGRAFCFTGTINKCGPDGKRFTRPMMHKIVIDNGGQAVDDVTAGVTTDLVQADVTSQSSKSKKATKFGVNIMSEEAFFELVE